MKSELGEQSFELPASEDFIKVLNDDKNLDNPPVFLHRINLSLVLKLLVYVEVLSY